MRRHYGTPAFLPRALYYRFGALLDGVAEMTYTTNGLGTARTGIGRRFQGAGGGAVDGKL
jgi:hypothetical protein